MRTPVISLLDVFVKVNILFGSQYSFRLMFIVHALTSYFFVSFQTINSLIFLQSFVSSFICGDSQNHNAFLLLIRKMWKEAWATLQCLISFRTNSL